MELKEVLAQVPGLEKRFVYYLESLGYIQPARVPKRRIARRDYAPADVQRIQELWRYYRQGYALQAAQALVARLATAPMCCFRCRGRAGTRPGAICWPCPGCGKLVCYTERRPTRWLAWRWPPRARSTRR